MASIAAPHAPPRRPATTSSGHRAGAVIVASLLALFLVPGLVAAHPLGNFTINHYAGVRIERDRILLDVVLDQAEIPAFQARLDLDLDGDGELSDEETAAGRIATCASLGRSLELRLDGKPLALELMEAGLTFPPGAGGLETMRSVCGYSAALATPLDGEHRVAFADRSFAERLGWREIVVEGSGVRVGPLVGELRSTSLSARLTAYPVDLLAQALADAAVEVQAIPGGAILPALDIPDADPVSNLGQASSPTGGGPDTGGGPAPVEAMPEPQATALVGPPGAAVPGGVASADLPSIFRTADLTPIVLVVSVLTAAALGAGHALTPGHGKTLMAAYLVGTRGTPVHAAGLGLSVALSHTLGILVLAALVTGAQGVLPPDVVVRTAPIVAAVSIVAIGGWMLLGEARRRLGAKARAHRHDHSHAHDHGHADHGHNHGYDHRHTQKAPGGEHSHGGIRHTHLPPGGAPLSWRGLFVLGLAGGLIPSASALLILLGSIAAGRPAFGFVLVVAFGLGMAMVMAGIGLAIVLARGRLDRADAASRLGRAGAQLPLVASVVVLGFGLYLTVQALAGAPTL